MRWKSPTLISFLMDNQKQLKEKIDSITISPETIKEQMAMRPPSGEKDRLRSLIVDIGEEIWKHKQLSLF